MNRVPAVCLVALLACSAVALPAHAQMGTRAYAPENLSRLSGSDRTRVISQEYAEQSNGRRIPEDQLRFYLDQVDSGWAFSQIRQDIATSLRGQGGRPGPGWNDRPGNGPGNRPGNGWGNAPGAGNAGTVRCESQDNRERTCNTGWRNARLVRQISGSACTEGQTWGMRNGAIWVTRGCRAEFVEARGHGGGGGGWGGGGGGDRDRDYSVTCSSNDKRRSTCAWEARQGRPVLIQQLSGSACQENRTWGYQDGSVWVSNGCRARFGVR